MTAKGDADKHDDGKAPVGLLSRAALLQIVEILRYGARKYDAHNWRKGLAWSRVIDATLRHLLAFNEGEDLDKESGLSHAAHAACNLMFLLEYTRTHPELDDRYRKPKEPMVWKVEVSVKEQNVTRTLDTTTDPADYLHTNRST